MASNRMERIKEDIRRELSAVIRTVKDPRVSPISSVVAVEVTKDLEHAKVYISVMGSDAEKKDTILGLNNAAGFIRREISIRLNLRNTPQFKFVLDTSVDYGIHINEIISKLNKEDK